MVSSGNYAEYNNVKTKLRIDDDSMRDEIRLYTQDIQDLVNNRLRAKLGTYNIYGKEIVLPLTHNTIPEIPLELKGISADLVVAKIRLQNSEKTTLWDSAVKILDDYLTKVYGWTRAQAYCPIREVTMTPVTGIANSQIVTISGKNFEPNKTLDILFDGIRVETTPTDVNTNTDGVFTDSTFTVPNSEKGQREVKIIDSLGGKILTFLVIE